MKQNSSLMNLVNNREFAPWEISCLVLTDILVELPTVQMKGSAVVDISFLLLMDVLQEILST